MTLPPRGGRFDAGLYRLPEKESSVEPLAGMPLWAEIRPRRVVFLSRAESPAVTLAGVQITRSLEIPDEEIDFRFSRSGGPGGQNVNKRSTKAELLFDVDRSTSLSPRARALIHARLGGRIDSDGILHVVSQAGRTQRENRERAVERFQALVAAALAPRPRPRVPTRPGKKAVQARLDSKRRRSKIKRSRARPSGED
jgi:ribosome-associated protein